MALSSSSIIAYLTMGSAAGSGASTPAASLGGTISTSAMNLGTPLNNLFRDDSPAEVTEPSFTAGFTNGSPVITGTAHGLYINQQVTFTTTSGLPSGFALTTPYYVIAAGFTVNAFEVSATLGGGAISAGSAGTGVQTCVPGPTVTYRAIDVKNTGAQSLLNAAFYMQTDTSYDTPPSTAFEYIDLAYDSTGTAFLTSEKDNQSGTTQLPAGLLWYSANTPSNTATVTGTASGGALTAITSIPTPGTSYKVGQVLLVAGGTGGYIIVTATTTPTSGIIAAVRILVVGTGYANNFTASATTALVATTYASGIILSTADLAASATARVWIRRTLFGASAITAPATDSFTFRMYGGTAP